MWKTHIYFGENESRVQVLFSRRIKKMNTKELKQFWDRKSSQKTKEINGKIIGRISRRLETYKLTPVVGEMLNTWESIQRHNNTLHNAWLRSADAYSATAGAHFSEEERIKKYFLILKNLKLRNESMKWGDSLFLPHILKPMILFLWSYST